ncbi:LysR substrate-binding domain-containing protein [Achromobacter mucicolens]|uniref:LysR substrate-binding domain-containing protein n=1 Tax=Achromobacter mucicolens TaxID=1389922 RepID=UPI0022F3C4A8|nr:LysR substrate-binding domain-containing protein [Achromobacter mucicolens]WBX86894.1 LysR substrate-binding domain-containing protein [Achromobacter mucicolens]
MDALEAHRVVNHLSNATGRPLDWRFSVNGEAVAVSLSSRYAVNETEAFLHCGLEGLGLIQLSELAASVYLRSGRLREVLADARCTPVPISIVYPQARFATGGGQDVRGMGHRDRAARAGRMNASDSHPGHEIDPLTLTLLPLLTDHLTAGWIP